MPVLLSELSDPEQQLIAALRSPDDFTISIQHRDGRFVVSRNTGLAADPSLGGGETFEEAWNAAGLFRE